MSNYNALFSKWLNKFIKNNIEAHKVAISIKTNNGFLRPKKINDHIPFKNNCKAKILSI